MRSFIQYIWKKCLARRCAAAIAASGLMLVAGSVYAQKSHHKILRTDPPRFGFYAKYLDCGGIPVRSSAGVEDRALLIAADKINRMLGHMPQARYNLVQWGAEMHIIGRNQQTSDLPEYRNGKRQNIYRYARNNNEY